MPSIDMSAMSDDTRDRFLELESREANEQLDDFAREELEQIRYEFMIG